MRLATWKALVILTGVTVCVSVVIALPRMAPIFTVKHDPITVRAVVAVESCIAGGVDAGSIESPDNYRVETLLQAMRNRVNEQPNEINELLDIYQKTNDRSRRSLVIGWIGMVQPDEVRNRSLQTILDFESDSSLKNMAKSALENGGQQTGQNEKRGEGQANFEGTP